MSEELKRWWQARPPRERLLLTILVPLALALLLWLLLVRPLGQMVEDARARHDQAVTHLARVRALDDAIGQARQRRSSASLPMPLDALVAGSAAQAGFPIASLASEVPGQARFAIEAVRPQPFFAWLRTLEAQGASVGRISTAANADRTLRVEVTLEADGG